MSKPAKSPARAPLLNPDGVNPVDASAHIFDDDCEESDILHYRHFIPGQIYYAGSDRFIEYIAGNIPLLITVPHGGYAAPSHIPDRVGGVHEPDIHTQELARYLYSAFAELGLGDLRPHMVINRLRRGRLDMNRNETDASGGNVVTKRSWRQFHAFSRRAKREIVRGRNVTNLEWRTAMAAAGAASSSSSAAPAPAAFSRGLCVDLHGQSHDARHQLGYVLNQQELSLLSDSKLDSSGEMIDKCSCRIAVDPVPHTPACVRAAQIGGLGTAGLTRDNPVSAPSSRPRSPTLLSQVIRGPTKSLGGLLESMGHPCIPSPLHPHAGDKLLYFNGGYNSYVNGSSCIGAQQRKKEQAADAVLLAARTAQGGIPLSTPDPDPQFSALFLDALEAERFLAIQMETAYEGNRDTHENMKKFAANLAKALCQWMRLHVLADGEGFLEDQPVPADRE